MQSKALTAATALVGLSLQPGQFTALLVKSGSFVGLINVPILSVGLENGLQILFAWGASPTLPSAAGDNGSASNDLFVTDKQSN